LTKNNSQKLAITLATTEF